MSSLLILLLSAALIHVIVLEHVPAWRPCILDRGIFDGAVGLAWASALALPAVAGSSHALMQLVLQPLGLEYLRTVAFVLLIVVIVATLEIVLTRSGRWTPVRPAFLALLSSHCAFFGVAWLGERRALSLGDALMLGIGAGLGFAFMLLALTAAHQRLRQASVPAILREAPIALITVGIMALGFMGFSGLIQE